MSKRKELHSLFDQWKTREHYVEANQFLRDGIIDEIIYEDQPVKILFIGKEANGLKEVDHDLTKNWGDNECSGLYDKRISEWAYGIQTDFDCYDNIGGVENKHRRFEALQKVAIMEVKKSSGVGECDNKRLVTIINEDRNFLHQQIKIIAPDVIVSCLVELNLVTALFPGIHFKRTGYTRCVFKWNSSRVIDFYHPSGQMPPAASYSLLQNIYQSEAFATL